MDQATLFSLSFEEKPVRVLHPEKSRSVKRTISDKLAVSSSDDRPRDEYGRWVSEGGARRKKLQERHSKLLDRLEKEDANPPAYGDKAWNIGKGGYDTRNQPGMSRPIVLGEIHHPHDRNARVPVVLREGMQDTTHPAGSGFGRRHIEFRHGQELRDKGFRDAVDFAGHIVNHHDIDVEDQRRGSRILAQKPEKESSNARTPLTPLRLHENGDHYSVTTAYRGKWRDVKKLKKQAEDSQRTEVPSHPPDARSGHGHEVVQTVPPQGPDGDRQGEDSPASPNMGRKDVSRQDDHELNAIPLLPPEHFRRAGHERKGTTMPCVTNGETPPETAAREAMEEVGTAPGG